MNNQHAHWCASNITGSPVPECNCQNPSTEIERLTAECERLRGENETLKAELGSKNP